MGKQLLVTGTGTDVGKTYVAGLIVKKLREAGRNAAYYKAAMSGNPRRSDGTPLPGDALRVQALSGSAQPLEEMYSYAYSAAMSPHLASKIEGNPVDLQRVLNDFDCLCRKYDYVTAEGAGGILCPLRFDSQRILLTDFITARSLPCLIVAGAGLGAINAVALTAEYMKKRSIRARGMILNRFEPGNILHEDNLHMCETLTGLRVIACVRDGDTDLPVPAGVLETLFEDGKDAAQPRT